MQLTVWTRNVAAHEAVMSSVDHNHVILPNAKIQSTSLSYYCCVN